MVVKLRFEKNMTRKGYGVAPLFDPLMVPWFQAATLNINPSAHSTLYLSLRAFQPSLLLNNPSQPNYNQFYSYFLAQIFSRTIKARKLNIKNHQINIKTSCFISNKKFSSGFLGSFWNIT